MVHSDDEEKTLTVGDAMLQCSIGNGRYGNTGCGVIKGGIQNYKGFWLKTNCSQIKSLNLANWCNGKVSKSAEI